MKVTREEINKLKQLDRIEFYSKINNINVNYQGGSIMIFITILIYIAIFRIHYSNLFFIIFSISALLIYIIISHYYNKNYNEKYESIEKEFFEVKGK